MRTFGYPLEFDADVSSEDQLILLLNGLPLANYPIAIATEGARQATTDAEGRGLVMLLAAHMSPPAEASGRFAKLLTSLSVAGH